MSYIPQYNGYTPTYYSPAYTPVNAGLQPKSSVDSVKIDIVNPKASMEPAGQMAPVANYSGLPGYAPVYPNYPYFPVNNPNFVNTQTLPQLNQQAQPQVQPVQQLQVQPQTQPVQQPQVQPEVQPQAQSVQQPAAQPVAQPQTPPVKAAIPETLIKAIDNALMSPDVNVRLSGATKLSKLFEDRKDEAANPALTALLNRVLKDPHQNVRLMGQIALNISAKGNEETVKIVQDMTTSKDGFGFESVAANENLLKMAERTDVVNKPATVNPVVTNNKGLNVVA